MTIEHSLITDPKIHEPKGAVAAAIGTTYVSDGAGSGSWIDIVPDGADTATIDEVFVSDGAGGGAFQKSILSTHAQINITNNVSATTVPAAVDPTLNTDTDYRKVSAGWASTHLSDVTFNIDELAVGATGEYSVHFWATVKVPSINNFIGIKYAIDDTAPYSLQKVKAQSITANDYKNLYAATIVNLTAGQTISVYVAGSKADNLIFEEAGLQVNLLNEG